MTTANFTLPSSPEDRRKIKNAMDEISASWTRMEGERNLVNDTLRELCKTYSLPKRAFRKLVKVYHTQSFNEEVASHEEFEAMYEELVK